MKLAAIDIGSNSIKLVVVEAAASDSFAVLAREREVVRLGHETLLKGHLGRSAILRAANCIKRFRSIAEARGAEKIVAIATASVREANNSANFIRAIEAKTGVRVEILSGIEEARLIGLASSRGCAPRESTNLNIDIGGGSAEISIFRDGTPLTLFSLKLGAVGLTERFLKTDPPRPKELKDLKAEIHGAFERPKRELKGIVWNDVTGTSGTILALGAALRTSNNKHEATGPAETAIKLSQLSELNEALARLNLAERREAASLSAQRAEIIIAGGQILEGTMQALGIQSLRTCDWALREGVIIDRLRDWHDQSRPPMPDIAEPKLRGVHAVGKRFGYEEAHSHQVARLSELIFDGLADSMKLTRHQRLLLSAAALLHDVGYHIAHESHHKHSLYLIENSELTGFSEAERSVIANVARYHKGSHPKEHHPNYMKLNLADRQSVCQLAGILRLADALDRRHDSRVAGLHCRRLRSTVHIQFYGSRECDSELAEAERRLELFSESFECLVKLSWQKSSGHNPERTRASTIIQSTTASNRH